MSMIEPLIPTTIDPDVEREQLIRQMADKLQELLEAIATNENLASAKQELSLFKHRSLIDRYLDWGSKRKPQYETVEGIRMGRYAQRWVVQENSGSLKIAHPADAQSDTVVLDDTLTFMLYRVFNWKRTPASTARQTFRMIYMTAVRELPSDHPLRVDAERAYVNSLVGAPPLR